MPTIQDVIQAATLTMTVTPVDRNPHMPGTSMNHWRCTLRNKTTKGRIQVYFSMGFGHHGKAPALAQVLDCLASDASSSDLPFEEWCAEYGYDSDSRKAERTYKTVQQSTGKLKALMRHHYHTLVYETERL